MNNSLCIIMSIYNGDKLDYIQQALESIYNQSTKGDIFIKIDGNVDAEVYTFLSNEYKSNKIAYLSKRGENRGLSISLNELLHVVFERGYQYIARMDADDVMLPNRLKLQYEFMQENIDIDVLGGFIEEFGDDFKYNKIVKYPLFHAGMYAFFAKRVPLAHPTTFFRRSFFEKAGLYPITSPTNEDTLLWLKGFSTGCKFANIPEVLVKVRVSKAFFGRRGGIVKSWSDFKDRVKVIKTLGYNNSSYFYALALFMVNIAPAKIKEFLYLRLR